MHIGLCVWGRAYGTGQGTRGGPSPPAGYTTRYTLPRGLSLGHTSRPLPLSQQGAGGRQGTSGRGKAGDGACPPVPAPWRASEGHLLVQRPQAALLSLGPTLGLAAGLARGPVAVRCPVRSGVGAFQRPDRSFGRGHVCTSFLHKTASTGPRNAPGPRGGPNYLSCGRRALAGR